MANLVYYKQTIKKRNSLQSKERYQNKRSRREERVANREENSSKPLSWIAQMKLKMMMNPKDYRDYLERQKVKGFRKTAVPDHELVPAIKKELITPAKLNWFEKTILKIRDFFRGLFKN